MADMVIDTNEIERVLADLSKTNPVFNNEREFQKCFAAALERLHYEVSTEYRPNCLDTDARIDILIHRPKRVAIELKYKTAEYSEPSHDQSWDLKLHGARDHGGTIS